MTDRPAREQDPTTPFYARPSGGWGSLKSVARHAVQDGMSLGTLATLRRQNKPGGHMCTSCAWAKPPDPHLAEFCENGAKATIWDLTRRRCGPDFFAAHRVAELRDWSDYDLEAQGRLTHPMRYDAQTDRYVPTSWDAAFQAIGSKLQALDPGSTAFYASGRASLETSFLYGLFARLYGHNNLSDSSNMCHETTSVALKKAIGSPVGTCVLQDFESCDLILFFGQNTGTNSPRFLHPIQDAVQRGCRIVTFNPVRERGLIQFLDPQSPAEMLGGQGTTISHPYLQLRPGSDIAAIAGLAKHLFDMDDTAPLIDRAFVAAHTTGFDAFERHIRALDWSQIEHACGLTRDDLHEVARIYARSERCIAVYGMGLTQHVHGSDSIAMLVNLLLMRGNMGRPGAGICPVRGHSNVQGQRTVGISEKPELVPLDRLARIFDFAPPRDPGWNTVHVLQALLDGRLRGFVSLGGNFARAIPDQSRTDPLWQGLALNVQIATRLNRSHVLVGDGAWLLPCLVRAERDMQGGKPQAVSMEDSLSHIHGSQGRRAPASDQLLSEPAIIAGIAQATLPDNPKVDWPGWVQDYARIRDLIAKVYPDQFSDFNARLFKAGGFYRGNPVRQRDWQTDSGKAGFAVPETLTALQGARQFTLITLRSNDQFNTTIYGDDDRLRGLRGDRMILMISRHDMHLLGLAKGDRISLCADYGDDIPRRVDGLRIVPYDLPPGCLAAYYPETNPLVALGSHDLQSGTPAYKGVPVRIERMAPIG
ncbi:FdhF/YdeP family oxidoreductase [Paracoccus shanxieyensis]|uniref:FdhF/YdeP family oxidoreductase n=1 Tax=Paracoccus shanxieyensis TaxID=2675752 RepID=A0A6L6IVS5_9RHOB|nr:FdhF/YdeP family oxidoreductase [Paracoccus shanxieyensis]MTH63989.1 FdhF/YdeP family oxidoreductase [Paracoccus shanxieyensis]MTH86970.1 FdhF/YdeP family oxidoreductase [Paracoccus shanxieyensis]